MEQVFIALGSNLHHPLRQVETAIEQLKAVPDTNLQNQSPWYRSRAVGPGSQPDYVNGVALLNTRLPPEELLAYLHQIEAKQGRERRQRWAARTIDLDILLYGNRIVATDRLQIPHPRLHQRNFVLYPLADLAPRLVLPDGRQLTALLRTCHRDDLKRLQPGDLD